MDIPFIVPGAAVDQFKRTLLGFPDELPDRAGCRRLGLHATTQIKRTIGRQIAGELANQPLDLEL
jgi:hypothetical protein